MTEDKQVIRVSSAATRADHRRLFAIDREVLGRKAEDARGNARRREVHILHRGPQDPLQRMLNAIQPASYVRPHRHLQPPKDESTPEGVAYLAELEDRVRSHLSLEPRPWQP